MIRMFIHHRAPKRVNNNTEIKSLPKSLTRFYLQYVFPGGWWLLLGWALVTAYMNMGMVLFPLTQKWIVSMFEQPYSGVEQFVVQNLPILILVVGLELSWTVFGALRQYFLSRIDVQMLRRISETLTDYLHSQSMQFWSEHKTGKISNQIDQIGRGLTVMSNLLKIFMFCIAICINVWLMTRINIWITVVFAVMFVMRLIYTLTMTKYVKRAATDASVAASTLSGHLVDSLSNNYIVRIFAGARAEHNYLAPVRTDNAQKALRNRVVQILMWAPFGLLWGLGYATVLVMCLVLYARGYMVVSAVVFSIAVYAEVTAAITNLINVLPELVDNIAAATRSYKELAMPISVQDKPDAGELIVPRGKIEFRNVSFKYRRKWILRNLNLTINPGERVGLVGGSGAGKSTLVHLLMRFWDVNSGQILIDGVDIRDVTQDSLHRAIGFIPQEPTLFDRSLRENIAYGRPGATDAQIRRASKRASADAFIMASDKKYDSLVGERGIKLSGGQKQRVAIARAFLKDAPILVLDEATSALDSETEVAIQKSFEDLAKGRTTIAIAHRLSTLRNMDRIVVMRDGQIIEQGSHNALLRRRGGEYARLWKMQSGGFLGDEK